ncbi:MAG: hypothetical protein ABJP82_20775, partial [Hyphomicrobiales bacterium]
MTDGLVDACRELDAILDQCLRTWVVETDLELETPNRDQIHSYYLERSTRLVQARTSLSEALENLSRERQTYRDNLELSHSSSLNFRQPEIPVRITLQCVCYSGSEPVDQCSTCSRPDRPSRAGTSARGIERCWNRPELGKLENCCCVDSDKAPQGTEDSTAPPAESPTDICVPESDETDTRTIVETRVVEDDVIGDQASSIEAKVHSE